MEYTVMIRRAEEGGYWAEIPALPGCFSQGETIEETVSNIKEAIAAHLLALQEERDARWPIPAEVAIIARSICTDGCAAKA